MSRKVVVWNKGGGLALREEDRQKRRHNTPQFGGRFPFNLRCVVKRKLQTSGLSEIAHSSFSAASLVCTDV